MLAKLFLVSSLLEIVLSVPLSPPQAKILSESNEVNPDGSFQWTYELDDGSKQQQSGELKQIGHDSGVVVQGSASWTDNEGGQHQISYLADENGYQPVSSDLPVGPEIPSSILKALEWIAAHPTPEKH